MVTFGLDISHHQDLGLDLAQCRREGIDFVFIKSTEGSGFIDNEFAANLAEARSAGLLVAAYHYVRSNASAAAQVANVQRVVPRDVSVIPDVEAYSGGIQLARDFITGLRGAGYSVPLLYLPRWYWQQLRSPSLAGLPPLWSSRYPDTVVGSLGDEWEDVPASYWTGYGGLPVAVLQFTSSVRIAGHQPLDANAYNGSRAQLAALLGGEEDDVGWNDQLAVPDGPNKGKTFAAGTMQAWTNYYAGDTWTRVVALQASVAAIANNQDITPDELGAIIDQAVAEHTPTAEQLAAAQRPFLEEIVREVVPAEQADNIVDALARRLANEEG